MNYDMYCPNCGTRQTIVADGVKTKCANEKCRAVLCVNEQFHANGFQVLVRFD